MTALEQLKKILINLELAKALRSDHHYTGEGILEAMFSQLDDKMSNEEFEAKFKVMKTLEEIIKQDKQRLEMFDHLLEDDYHGLLYSLAVELRMMSYEELQKLASFEQEGW